MSEELQPPPPDQPHAGEIAGEALADAAEPPPVEEAPPALICPHCGTAIEPDATDAGPFIRCPACEVEFMAEADSRGEDDEDDSAREAVKAQQHLHDTELSEMRIRNLSVQGRAAIRARTYVLLGTIGCLVTAGWLATSVYQQVRALHRLDLAGIGYVLIIAASLLGAAFFGRRARALTEELGQSRLTEPETPPDFSALSDGSQHWKHLEELAEKPSE